jgi:hypothetical protein
MYKASRLNHERYGRVIEIVRDDSEEYVTPFQVVNRAITMRRLWMEEEPAKVRILIDGQVMITKRAETWANQEYASLPKCENCAKILNGQVFTHSLSEVFLFCSERCSDNNFNYLVSQRDEEYECDL